MASIWVPEWVHAAQETKARISRRNTRQRQKRNGEAADGQIRENNETETGYRQNSRTGKHQYAGNGRQNHPVSEPERAGKGSDCCRQGRSPVSKSPHRKHVDGRKWRRS